MEATWAEMWARADAEGGGGRDDIPNGSYPFVVESANWKQSGSGKDMIEAVFLIQGTAFDGRRLWNNFVLSPDNGKALAVFQRQMGALGIDRPTLDALPQPASVGMQYLASVLVGRQGVAVVGRGRGEYADSYEVKNVKPAGSVQVPQAGAVAAPVPGQTIPQVPAPSAAPIPAAPPQAAVPQQLVPQVPPVPAPPAVVPQPVQAAPPAVPAPGAAPAAVAPPVNPVAPTAPAPEPVPAVPTAPPVPQAPPAVPAAPTAPAEGATPGQPPF